MFIATTQNNLYKINAKTGEIAKTLNLGVPFMATELGGEYPIIYSIQLRYSNVILACNDIYPTIGVSGTGVIDPATGLWYLTSKTYRQEVGKT